MPLADHGSTTKMKITKRQLRRIIKEEKQKLNEAGPLPDGWDDVSGDDIIDGYYNAVSQLIFDDMAAAGVDPHKSPEEVQYAIQALTNLLADLQAGNF